MQNLGYISVFLTSMANGYGGRCPAFDNLITQEVLAMHYELSSKDLVQVANDGPGSQILAELLSDGVDVSNVVVRHGPEDISIVASVESCSFMKYMKNLGKFSRPSILLRLPFFYAARVHEYPVLCGL